MNVEKSKYISLALQQATKALTLSNPNPRVGCVIVSQRGEIIGVGHTQKAGGAHAEIMALQDAVNKKKDVTGATVYVTLEPCAHQGKTGPCCEALIAAKISKVIASLYDPNPLVAGRGFERLRSSGITVEIGPGSRESRELNLGFLSRMIRKTPWVRLKIAASLDGITALTNGKSQWITSSEARQDGHIWRSRASAILTGSGTILKDNPKLDTRYVSVIRQPDLAIIDSQLQTPVDAKIFSVTRNIYIYTTSKDLKRRSALEAVGALVILTNASEHGRVSLDFVLKDLAKREVNELHVEGGEGLNGALISNDLVDEYLIYLAPIILGQGNGIAKYGPLSEIESAKKFSFLSTKLIGGDIRILARDSSKSIFYK
jgi:diaminohydroxyphosphoribosylaminopyrimidine deaminase/5-amino-6-(5-phosphoribosylamino)uracil reductase